MQVTVFSFFMSVIWVSIFAWAVSILRKQMFFLQCFSIYPLLAVLTACVLRLFCVFELPFTQIVTSEQILPVMQHILYYPLILIDGMLTITLLNCIVILWVVVAVRQFSVKIKNYIRFQRFLQLLPTSADTRLYQILKQVQSKSWLVRPTKIIVHKEIRSPAVAGFFSPVILLPTIAFTEEELLGIFAHEWCHYCNGHFLIKCISEVVQSVFWWNPLFKRLGNEIAHALEMHSDKRVGQLLDRSQQLVYLKSIMRVLGRSCDGNRTINPFTCSLLEKDNQEFLVQRFEMILRGNYLIHKTGKFLITLSAVILLFMSSYLFVIQPYHLPDEEEIGIRTDIPDDAYLVKEQDTYLLFDGQGNLMAEVKYIDESLGKLKIIETREGE